MEKLLHYVWLHKMLPPEGLVTDKGENIEVIDQGLRNTDAGPDFFNAKIRVGGQTWVGNVEIHQRASDWFRHGHEKDPAYDNVILHVCATLDDTAVTASGRTLPQTVLAVPKRVESNYSELMDSMSRPPCFAVIGQMPSIGVRLWLSSLTIERFEEKTRRIGQWLERSWGDWERVFFIALARSFGFGINSDAFEQWAWSVEPQSVGKHRDDVFQVEAFFFGQAGLLNEDAIPEERQDSHFKELRKEYIYLAHKFSLTPISRKLWRFLRLRPQNFPYVRLSQLAALYCSRKASLSRLLEARTTDEIKAMFQTAATGYWDSHYSFGLPADAHSKKLQEASLDLLVINAAAPLLFAYGRRHFNEQLAERAFDMLEATKPEQNAITRQWAKAGIKAKSAADSQALIQLKRNYCDKRDCLRCRIGCEYLRKKG